MPLGDGERQFFEQGFFDIFRGKEGKAEAASDRAEHFRDKAERLDAKSERLSPQLAAAREEEDVEIDTPRGRARTRMRIPQIQALKAALEEQNKVNQEQAEALKAASDALAELRADHEKLQAGVLKAMRAIRQRMKRKDDDFKFLSEALLAGVNGLIEVVNVSDTVQQPMAKAGAAVLTNLAAADRIKDNNQEKMLMAGAVLLNAIAYYDAAEGLASILSSDTGGLLSGTTAPAEPAAAPTTTTGVDWQAVADQLRADGNALGAAWVESQYVGA